MKDMHGYTPKDAAYDTAIGWIRQAYFGNTGDLDFYGKMSTHRDPPPAYTKEFKKQLAKLHNKLLDASGLDGTHLDNPEQLTLEV